MLLDISGKKAMSTAPASATSSSSRSSRLNWQPSQDANLKTPMRCLCFTYLAFPTLSIWNNPRLLVVGRTFGIAAAAGALAGITNSGKSFRKSYAVPARGPLPDGRASELLLELTQVSHPVPHLTIRKDRPILADEVRTHLAMPAESHGAFHVAFHREIDPVIREFPALQAANSEPHHDLRTAHHGYGSFRPQRNKVE